MTKLKITMLGEFSVSCGEVTLNEQNKRSKKLWTLFQYLVTFHDREISQNELLEALWEDESSDNPAGALKTQMHRLRAMLSELGYEGEIIINTRGTYALNNSIDFSIDAEEFEELCKKGQRAEGEKEKMEYFRRAITVYKGDFLPKISLERWVVPINTYYRALYIKTVHLACDLMYNQGRLHDVADICRKAIIIDPYDEPLHYNLIKVLAELGDQQNAKAAYKYVTDLFYNKFGVNPSDELMSLYNETVKSQKNIELDLSVVAESLNEQDEHRGAFYCEYEFFRHIYQLEMRDATRTNKSINICLLTVTDIDGEIPEQKALNRCMEKLSDTIRQYLRCNDVYARYSVSQYVIMLPNTNKQNCELVMQRIVRNYRRDNPRSQMLIGYKFQLMNTEKYKFNGNDDNA